MRSDQKNALVTVQTMLEKSKPTIQMALPEHLKLDRVIRIALTELRTNPGLLRCKPESVVAGIVKSSQLGLEIGSALGQAYLVPFGQEATLIIGYRGLIALARRSGEIVSITARCVFEGDEFELEYGLEEKLSHRPCANPGEMTHAYAIAKLTGGGIQYEVMLRNEIDSIRARSRAGNSGPWVTDYHEMARKTVVRRLAKYLPISIEMAEAISVDADRLQDVEVMDVSETSNGIMDRARALEQQETVVDTKEQAKEDTEEDPKVVDTHLPEWPQKRADGLLVDARGIPYHGDFYSVSKTCTQEGHWRRKRGAHPNAVNEYEESCLASAQKQSADDGPAQDEQREVTVDAITEDGMLDLIKQAHGTDELKVLAERVENHPAWDQSVKDDLLAKARDFYAEWQEVESQEETTKETTVEVI